MDGVIKHIVVHNGDKIKEENEFVKKGEVIISGNLFKDGNLIDSVNAKGSVYAEVWYNVNISIPLEYQKKEYTSNERYNFIVDKKRLFKQKYDYYDEEEI